ncbi:hypothetical protein C7H62_2679 [Mesoflavibacter sp. HG96]|uniref:hypothetical protein n=1 Tax=Mesoflavibacter TaxID=444051 RepID=UPI000D10B0D0|nr:MULTISPECIES: hypothetical protein [Mesoflavibacter]QIJ90487.1 hypothetical protein C7H62_2679 [Mesoflavibacter sp. HG96]QIJ93215.1 hypothetical protein C7H56_2679 [Mesoflavibacter sp. HG37]
MKNFTIITVLFLVLSSCVGRKQIEKQLNTGNYDQAINNALKKLETNKNVKRKQDYVYMLREAYYKVVEDNLYRIDQLIKDGNPEYYQDIFNIYRQLDSRQNSIKSVLPLHLNGKEVKFKFNNYTSNIVAYKNKVSDYKYEQAKQLLATNAKYDARQAYTLLEDIEAINPNFKDIRELMDQAHFIGTVFVLVAVKNETNQIVPTRLEDDLLNLDTYGLNNKFWTSYHSTPLSDISYDYSMDLELKRINISPEHVYEKQQLRELEVVDGWGYVLDENGNVAKDSLGNDIKQDKIVTVRARFFEIQQVKSTQVIGKVVFTDLKLNQILESFPIDSEFIFENFYGRVNGDRRALNEDDIQLLGNRAVPFPSNEQMVFDTGEDLKLKLKDIIRRMTFS